MFIIPSFFYYCTIVLFAFKYVINIREFNVKYTSYHRNCVTNLGIYIKCTAYYEIEWLGCVLRTTNKLKINKRWKFQYFTSISHIKKPLFINDLILLVISCVWPSTYVCTCTYTYYIMNVIHRQFTSLLSFNFRPVLFVLSLASGYVTHPTPMKLCFEL